MRENSPPHIPDIGEELEEVPFDNDIPPEDSDDEELEEVTFEELEARLREENNENDSEIDTDDTPDEAKLTFAKHCAPVFTCQQHPHIPIAVSGGEDDKAFVWNTTNGRIVFPIEYHTDTVIFTQFNHDGRYLATGDMNGEIYVYKIEERASGSDQSSTNNNNNNDDDESVIYPNENLKFTHIWSYSMGDMAWMRWHFAAPILFAGSDSGVIYFWRIPTGDCKVLPSTGGRCEIAELSYDGKKLFASYAAHKIILWDLKTCQSVFEIDEEHPMGHKGDIVAVACCKDSPVYISGDVNGKILICTNNGPVSSQIVDDAIECLAFSPSQDFKLFASGCIGGKVIIWDYGKNTQRCICENTSESTDGIPTMIWINDFTLVVGTMKGKIHAFDGRTGQHKFSLSGHVAHIYDLHYKKLNHTLLSASEDITAKIFNLPDFCE